MRDRKKTRKRRKNATKPRLTAADKTLLKHLRATLRMPEPILAVMGGWDKSTARRMIRDLMHGKRPNYGPGTLFNFHGAFNTKPGAVAKEKKVRGSFIKTVWYKSGPRYAVLTRAQNPRRKAPPKPKRKPKPTAGDVAVWRSLGMNPIRRKRKRRKNGLWPATGTIVDQIRHGDRVTIVDRFGQSRTGRAVMLRGDGQGWVLNMGGAHGTPGLAGPSNTVRVSKSRRNSRARRRNGNGADELFEKFHGRPSTKSLFVEDLADHAELAKLGDLGVLRVKPVRGEVFEITWQQNSPILAAEPGGRQLFFIGGDQTIDVGKMGVDSTKDLIDLGECTRIEYHTRKGFDNFAPITYYHKFGEETGVCPRLVYEKASKRMMLVGGAYSVKPEGIVN